MACQNRYFRHAKYKQECKSLPTAGYGSFPGSYKAIDGPISRCGVLAGGSQTQKREQPLYGCTFFPENEAQHLILATQDRWFIRARRVLLLHVEQY